MDSNTSSFNTRHVVVFVAVTSNSMDIYNNHFIIALSITTHVSNSPASQFVKINLIAQQVAYSKLGDTIYRQ